MQTIDTFLMFNTQAEDAAKFYVSLFKDSKILKTTYYSKREIEALARVPEDQRPGPAGSVKTVTFTMLGRLYQACNGGNYFKFSHGISLYVNCDTQAEIDFLWDKISEGGRVEECGWIKDKFGVPWQIAPTELEKWQSDPDSEKSDRVALEVYKSRKLNIAKLKRAYMGAH